MSTPQGAVAPYQGQAVQPSAVIDSKAVAAHGFFATLARLVRESGVFRDEASMLRAVESVLGMEKHLVPDASTRNSVVREHDVAPVEDVRLRKPPAGGVVPQPAGTPPIDYALLAQYIVAAQQQAQSQPAPEVHEITDAPAKVDSAPASEDGGFYPQSGEAK